MLVTVKPIERKKWHGKQGKESFQRPIFIQAMPNAETSKYNTGLTEEDIKFLSEKHLGYDLSDTYVKGVIHPFWDAPVGKVELKNATKIYNTDKPLDRIAVGIMKGSPLVANTKAELEQGLWPEATHIIFSEEEENEILASKIQIKRQATVASMDATDAKKAQIVMVMTGINVKGKDSNTIDVEFDKVLEEKPKEVLRQLKMNSEELSLNALVLEGLQKSVLRKKGINILYHDSVLGSDVATVVDYLMKEENNDFKVRLIEAIA